MTNVALTDADIARVQASFKKVAPISDEAARIFYARLFEVAPSVQPMFKAPLEEQGRKLMATLAVVVNGLRNLEKIVPVAQKLAIQHVQYGVRPEHYQTVGECLSYTLQTALGDEMTPELESSWAKAYATLSRVMISAAYGTEELAAAV
jgi:nitric oxide dioxygenase